MKLPKRSFPPNIIPLEKITILVSNQQQHLFCGIAVILTFFSKTIVRFLTVLPLVTSLSAGKFYILGNSVKFKLNPLRNIKYLTGH